MGALVTLRDLDSLESINTQLQVSERLAALGRITAGVAHEVKNPLSGIRGAAQLLETSVDPQDRELAVLIYPELDLRIVGINFTVRIDAPNAGAGAHGNLCERSRGLNPDPPRRIPTINEPLGIQAPDGAVSAK